MLIFLNEKFSQARSDSIEQAIGRTTCKPGSVKTRECGGRWSIRADLRR